ncbi:hypothetical protein U9Y21_12145, partial [Escherichia coli]
GGKNSLNRLIRCVCGKKIGPDPRNFNQRVSLGRNDLLIRTFPKSSLVNRLNFTHPLLLPIDYNLWLESIDKEGLDTIASEFEISLNDLIPGLERNKSGATERVKTVDYIFEEDKEKPMFPVF